MGWAGKLRALDDRVAPDRSRGRYDARRPWWVFYAWLFGGLLGGLGVQTFVHIGGPGGMPVRWFAASCSSPYCWPFIDGIGGIASAVTEGTQIACIVGGYADACATGNR